MMDLNLCGEIKAFAVKICCFVVKQLFSESVIASEPGALFLK